MQVRKHREPHCRVGTEKRRWRGVRHDATGKVPRAATSRLARRRYPAMLHDRPPSSEDPRRYADANGQTSGIPSVAAECPHHPDAFRLAKCNQWLNDYRLIRSTGRTDHSFQSEVLNFYTAGRVFETLTGLRWALVHALQEQSPMSTQCRCGRRLAVWCTMWPVCIDDAGVKPARVVSRPGLPLPLQSVPLDTCPRTASCCLAESSHQPFRRRVG